MTRRFLGVITFLCWNNGFASVQNIEFTQEKQKLTKIVVIKKLKERKQ